MISQRERDSLNLDHAFVELKWCSPVWMYWYILLGTRLKEAGPITNAPDRVLLYATTRAEGPVLSSKRLFTGCEF
jgi:hypothetical protein